MKININFDKNEMVMTATQALQEQIINYVKNADTRILKMFRAIIEVENEETSKLSEEQKAILDERYDSYKKDGVVITWEDVNKQADELISTFKS